MYLVMFYAATMIIFTMYGGGFATIPAYLADMFGTMHVGGIHGRLLTAWSTAGVIGPVAIAELRSLSYNSSLKDLVDKIDPAAFVDKFGAPMSQLEELVSAKTVTISKLMVLLAIRSSSPLAGMIHRLMKKMVLLFMITIKTKKLEFRKKTKVAILMFMISRRLLRI